MTASAAILQVALTPRLIRQHGPFRTSSSVKSAIVLPLGCEKAVEELFRGLRRTVERRGRHVLVQRPPGTGKSSLAVYIGGYRPGVPYTSMSGADLAPLGASGPPEFRRVLAWVKGRRRRKNS